MSASAKEIEKQALELPTAEREALANRLFQSVHNQELTTIDQEWLKLAEKRYSALKNGSDPGLSEDEFFEKLENK